MSDNLPYLVVRADCSSDIGIGHFFRCLALAHAWMAKDGKVVFLSHCESETLRERLNQDGISFAHIACCHPDPMDLNQMLRFLDNLRNNHSCRRPWTVLDGYHFDHGYQQTVREGGSHVMAIDDMNHLPRYDVDLLLNQNMDADTLAYHCSAKTILLLGLEYTLLRPEFLVHRKQKRAFPPIARNVLLTLGGSDTENVTERVIEALGLIKIPGMEVGVVIGPSNRHGSDVRRKLEESRFKWHVYHSPDNMPELMEWADLAISAGGSTCWELAFMGLPFVSIVLAENQRSIAEGLAKADVTINMGWHASCSKEEMAEAIFKVAQHADKSVEHVFSLEPSEMKAFVGKIREVEIALGSPRRYLHPAEKENRTNIRRSIYLKAPVQKGRRLGECAVEFRRPGFGIGPDMYELLLDNIFCRDLPAGYMLQLWDLKNADI